MNESCIEVRACLDDLVDGALDARESAEVRDHLSGCEACAREHAALRAVVEGAATLGAGAEPRRDLWPGIRDRIVATRSPVPATNRAYRLWAWSATAAAVVLAGMLVVLGGRALPPKPDPASGGRTATEAVLAAYETAERAYRADRDAVLEILRSGEHGADPATIGFVLDHLERMERSAREIRAALELEPSDDTLRRLWMATYRQRVDLLRTVGGMTTWTARPEDVS